MTGDRSGRAEAGPGAVRAVDDDGERADGAAVEADAQSPVVRGSRPHALPRGIPEAPRRSLPSHFTLRTLLVEPGQVLGARSVVDHLGSLAETKDASDPKHSPASSAFAGINPLHYNPYTGIKRSQDDVVFN